MFHDPAEVGLVVEAALDRHLAERHRGLAEQVDGTPDAGVAEDLPDGRMAMAAEGGAHRDGMDAGVGGKRGQGEVAACGGDQVAEEFLVIDTAVVLSRGGPDPVWFDLGGSVTLMAATVAGAWLAARRRISER